VTADDDTSAWLRFDRQHVWHPYAALPGKDPRYLVTGSDGVYLELSDGRRMIDGMSSWWTALLGHRHPALMRALEAQLARLPHVMFGGLTHTPALRLTEKLLGLVPPGLSRVFFSDSGSVSVEVAMKMALQYWESRGVPARKRFLSVRGGYHGDTFGAMSLCDPVTGMHRAFAGTVAEQVFAPRPKSPFGAPLDPNELAELERVFAQHGPTLCAVMVEPIAQNAGGLHFYSAEYLAALRRLCDETGILLILDEIATGFGRTGKLFACEHAGVVPDIMCIGKALTGGVIGLAATLARPHIAEAISNGDPGLFMHGPTYMANPLACSVACAVLDELGSFDWKARVAAIEAQLQSELEPCRALSQVADVRVLGAIGVVELYAPIELEQMVPQLVERGVWLRPFGKLLYTMPPFVITEPELARVTRAMLEVCA
jgi:adenosylmethionine-8-amino-7-oxononanoate aminotransferase